MKKIKLSLMALLIILSTFSPLLPLTNNTAYAESIVYGDVNGDDTVSMYDVVYIQKSIAKLVVLLPESVKRADLDCNCDISLSDVVAVQKIISKLYTTNFSLDTDDIVMGNGEKVKLQVNCASAPFNKEITYGTYDSTVASISASGTITAYNIGTATVSATNMLGYEAKCNVTVKQEPKRVVLNHSSYTLKEGESVDLDSYVNKGSASSSRVYSSSDESVAVVNRHGIVKALSFGKAVITCTLYNGLKAKCVITVIPSNEKIRKNLDPNKPMIALTFDDGPSADATPIILDALEKYGARASFFVVGNRLNGANANQLKRAFALGCEIGNHSYSHAYMDSLSNKEIAQQIYSCRDKIYSIIGEYPTLFRLPGGITANAVYQYAKAPIINWSVDTRDWETLSANTTYRSVLNNASDGDIVLMHDLYISTALAAQKIIPELINKGYQLVTVSELAYYKGYTLKNGAVYYCFR